MAATTLRPRQITFEIDVYRCRDVPRRVCPRPSVWGTQIPPAVGDAYMWIAAAAEQFLG